MLTGGFLKVGITALTQGEFGIVQSSMVGSILSGTLLVRSPLFTSLHSFLTVFEILGTCLYVAGYGREEVRFNEDLSGIMSSLMASQR